MGKTGETSKDHTALILRRIVSIKKGGMEEELSPLDLHELGLCYYHLGLRRQSIHYLAGLIQRHPDYIEIASAYQLQILAMIEAGDFQEAEQLIQKRLKIRQLDIRLLSMLAYIYEKKGRYKLAIQILGRILELNPEEPNALNSMAYLLTLHGTKKPQERRYALSCLHKALLAKKEYPAYLDSLGVYYAQIGDRERAYRSFLKALQKAPDHPEILAHFKAVSK